MRKSIQTFVGLDVGDRSCVAVALDRAGTRVALVTVTLSATEVLGFLEDLPGPVRVAMEVGTHSPWLSELLADQGYEVVVGNARKLALIYEATNKQDRVDAEKLARLARVDATLLYPVRHRRLQTRQDLAVIRTRAHLVAMRAGAVTLVRGMVKSFGGRVPGGATRHFARRAADAIPEGLRPALEPVLSTISHLTGLIEQSEKLLEDLARQRYPQCRALTQVHGVGLLTALCFVLTLEDPGRFRRSRDVGPALGLVPRRDQSGAMDRQLSITKTGDPYLRVLLTEAAHATMRRGAPPSDLREFGRRVASRGAKRGRKRALTAVARKLAVLLHRLWVTQAEYQPLRRKVAA